MTSIFHFSFFLDFFLWMHNLDYHWFQFLPATSISKIIVAFHLFPATGQSISISSTLYLSISFSKYTILKKRNFWPRKYISSIFISGHQFLSENYFHIRKSEEWSENLPSCEIVIRFFFLFFLLFVIHNNSNLLLNIKSKIKNLRIDLIYFLFL